MEIQSTVSGSALPSLIASPSPEVSPEAISTTVVNRLGRYWKNLVALMSPNSWPIPPGTRAPCQHTYIRGLY